jgi:hypothetical protein
MFADRKRLVCRPVRQQAGRLVDEQVSGLMRAGFILAREQVGRKKREYICRWVRGQDGT